MPKSSVIVIFTLFCAVLFSRGADSDACKSVDELLTTYGYAYRRHNLTTPDGYILGLYHFLGPKNATGLESRPPLLLQHGIAASADSFFGHGAQGAATYFYSKGFDVWVGSVRGTKYSRGHTRLSPDDPKYWDFSFEELGKYDSLTFVGYIYNETQFKRVYYLGFSRGFMQIMAGFAMEPEFFRLRLAKIAGWAPVVRTDLTTHLAVILAAETGLDSLSQ